MEKKIVNVIKYIMCSICYLLCNLKMLGRIVIKLNKSRSRRRRKQKEAQRKKINNNKTNNQKINNKKIIVIFAIIIVIAILAYLLKSDTYNIKQVEIEGNVEITKEEAISLSDIKVGQNIFLTSELVTKLKMKENVYI